MRLTKRIPTSAPLATAMVTVVLVGVTAVSATGADPTQTTLPTTVERVSVGTDGSQGANDASLPEISASGRYVVFTADAGSLVPNGFSDVFLRDVTSGTTTRVSVGLSPVASAVPTGVPANRHSANPAVSADGRYVAFDSQASNLVPNGTPNQAVYVRDLVNKTTTRIADGSFPSISADGRYVAYQAVGSTRRSTGGYAYDVFVRDLVNKTTTRASVPLSTGTGYDDSSRPSISADGRYVAFVSGASNLVPNDTNGRADLFVRDLVNKTTTLASVAASGAQLSGGTISVDCALSPDGRYAAFSSSAANLVPDDTNGVSDVFLRDLVNRTTTRVSVRSTGEQGSLDSYLPAISAGGRYVVFVSRASLASNDGNGRLSDVFVRDLVNQTTTLVSVTTSGGMAIGESRYASISADGHKVAYQSYATELVENDTNRREDVFLASFS